MIERAKDFKDYVNNRVFWPGAFIIGGGFLMASGADYFWNGEYKFNQDIKQCEKTLTQLDPPVYTLKSLSNNTCIQIEQGTPSSTLIAQYNSQHEKDAQGNLIKLGLGSIAFGGIIIKDIVLPLVLRRKK